jgi:hypothetical protein
MNIDVVAHGSERDAAILTAANMLTGELRCNSVPELVSNVLDRAAGNPINRLRLFAHGNEGIIACGHAPAELSLRSQLEHIERHQAIYIAVFHHRGIHPDGRVEESFPILNEDVLARLRPSLRGSGYVELHVCYVARGRLGRRLLTELERIWGCRVYGSALAQVPGGGLEGKKLHG